MQHTRVRYITALFVSTLIMRCGGLGAQRLGTPAGQECLEEQQEDRRYGATAERPPRKIVLAFLGFVGHKNCLRDIQAAFERIDIEFISASPEDPRLHSRWECCAQLDACTMQCCERHLGLGSIQSQVRAAQAILQHERITDKDQVTLLGHSQGGLSAVEFYRQLGERYSIKGIVTMTAPLQGVELIASLRSCETMCAAISMASSEDSCQRTIAYCCACCLPGCIAPLFNYGCGPCCCAGITDMAPNSRQLRLLRGAYAQMSAKGVPLLAITAQCPAAEDMEGLPHGAQGTMLLLSGTQGEPNDGLVATRHQVPPTTVQPELYARSQYDANHGVADVANHPRIFSHPEAINRVVTFCQQQLESIGAEEARKLR